MRILPLLFLVLPVALAQPVIESIENNASSISVPLTGQMLVAIHGRNLAPETAAADDYPRPRALAGVSVTFNGEAAPLLYVSPDQINAHVPSSVNAQFTAQVVVHTPQGDSDPFFMPVVLTPVPGIFTQNATGCGQGFVFNVHADGSTSLNTPSNSLDPERDWGLTIFATGLGVRETRTDGEPWTFDGITEGSRFRRVYFGIPGIQSTDQFEPVYAGPMPGTEGVDQINVPLAAPPDRLKRGCRVPMWVASEQRRSSRYVAVSIKDGGGVCTEPAQESVGAIEIEWKTVIEADGSRTSSAAIDAQFRRGTELRRPRGGSASFYFSVLGYDPPYCAAAFPATIGAGRLNITGGAFGDYSLLPEAGQDVLSYHADLDPAATLTGQVNIAATGVAGQVGPFTTTADIPPPIEITTDLSAGTSLASPFTLRWRNGDQRSIVNVERRIHVPGDDQVGTAGAGTGGSAGEVTIGFPVPIGPGPAYAAGVGASLVVTQSIRDQVPVVGGPAVDAGLFSAPGLTLGGRVVWRYVWEFRGLAP